MVRSTSGAQRTETEAPARSTSYSAATIEGIFFSIWINTVHRGCVLGSVYHVYAAMCMYTTRMQWRSLAGEGKVKGELPLISSNK